MEGHGLVKKFRDALIDGKDALATAAVMFDALRDGNKAEFSLDVLLSKEFKDLKCPGYIAEGLHWLEERLKKKQIDGMRPGNPS